VTVGRSVRRPARAIMRLVGRLLSLTMLLSACGRIGFDATDAGPLTYRGAVLADHPLHYWRLSDDGPVAADDLGTENGSYVGGCQQGVAGLLADDPDTAVRFDGTSCEVTLGDDLEFSGPTSFSVELWVIDTLVNDSTQHYFTVETRSGESPSDGYALLLLGGTQLKFERVVATTQSASSEATTPGSRVYLVGVYDAALGMSQLYVNGASVSTAADARAMATFSVTGLIGAQPDGDFVQGTLGQVAVYAHPLTADRIALHYQIGALGPM
jgi:hypothetical protein